jgi:hypothetical protein
MREGVRPALAIDASSTIEDRTIDITTTGRSTAERRVLDRIGKPGEAPTLWHHREWMAEERPFNAAQPNWERADVIVCGNWQIPYDPITEIVLVRRKDIAS